MVSTVTDTTLLSNFSHAGRPDLVNLAFPGLVIPTVVLDEIDAGVRLGYFPSYDWSPIPLLDPTPAETSALERSSPSLHEGERACIALALRLKALLVTDDRDARRVAKALGLRVSGTLGALCNLVDQRHLTINAADELLAKMRLKGYRCPFTSVKALLA